MWYSSRKEKTALSQMLKQRWKYSKMHSVLNDKPSSCLYYANTFSPGRSGVIWHAEEYGNERKKEKWQSHSIENCQRTVAAPDTDICKGHTPSQSGCFYIHILHPQNCSEKTWQNNQWKSSELMLEKVADNETDSFFFKIQGNIMVVPKE